jgi:hypothetical protein
VEFFLFGERERTKEKSAGLRMHHQEPVMMIFYFSLWTTPKRKVAKEKELVGVTGFEPATYTSRT